MGSWGPIPTTTSEGKKVKQLDAAIALAHLSRCNWRVAAILTKSGVVIAAATNVPRGLDGPRPVRLHTYAPQHATWSPSVHAEWAVLDLARGQAHGATLWVARIGKNGNPLDASPCKRCAPRIERMGVRSIRHT